MRLFFPLLLAAALLATPTVAAPAAEPSPYRLFAVQEARVAAVGYRLTTANAAWCPDIQPQFGWLLGDARLYDAARRAEALAAYGAGDADAPFVAAIAPDSPAARANVRTGTPIVAVNGIAVPPGAAERPFSRILALEALLAAQPPAAAARIGVGTTAIEITPVAGCAADFRLEPSRRAGAFAKDRIIRVNSALAEFATDDAHLAAAIAHELAHNILRHGARLDAAGVDRGALREFGRSGRLFRQTETEADRLSVWLLANAGYDPEVALRFAEAFGTRAGRPLIVGFTHPRLPTRLATIREEIAAIATVRAAGQPLRPPLIDNPPPLE